MKEDADRGGFKRATKLPNWRLTSSESQASWCRT